MKPTNQELIDSISELNNYRDRLRSEIINISQKLRMSQEKIKATLEESSELKTLDTTIRALSAQISKNN